MVIVTVVRTLHAYTNIIKILSQPLMLIIRVLILNVKDVLPKEALSLYRAGKMLVTIVDDTHLLEMNTLRRIRLLLEDFPKNYNLILVGQLTLLYVPSTASCRKSVSFLPAGSCQG